MLPGHPQFSWAWRKQAADRTLHMNRERLWWVQEEANTSPLSSCRPHAKALPEGWGPAAAGLLGAREAELWVELGCCRLAALAPKVGSG